MNTDKHPWTPSEPLRKKLNEDNVQTEDLLIAVLECFEYLLGSKAFARPIIDQQFRKEDLSMQHPDKEGLVRAIDNLIKVSLCFKSEDMVRQSKNKLLRFVNHCKTDIAQRTVDIISESDIVISRNLGLEMATRLGFSKTDCNKIATTISELARNIVRYAGSGKITIQPLIGDQKGIEILSEDFGSGIENLDEIMGGSYQSKEGLGMGIVGSKRLMDEFDIETGEDGTRIRAVKFLR